MGLKRGEKRGGGRVKAEDIRPRAPLLYFRKKETAGYHKKVEGIAATNCCDNTTDIAIEI